MVSIRWPFGRAARVSAPEVKESRTGAVVVFSGVGRARWTPNDYASLAREGYQKNAVAYRYIRMIAEAAAAAPFAVFVRGRIEDWSAEARFAGALSRAGAMDGLSIGYRTARARRQGRLRVLSGVDLWEVSLVPFPMLPGARFSVV